MTKPRELSSYPNPNSIDGSRIVDASIDYSKLAPNVFGGGAAINVKSFGVVGNGSDDDTENIQLAFDSISEYETLVFPNGEYRTNGCITITTPNIGVIFNGCTFLVGDTGTAGIYLNGGVAKTGFLFQQAHGCHIIGSATFIGQGTPGSPGTPGATSLLGMAWDNCDDVNCPAFMRFERMAIGRLMQNCTRGSWGDVQGDTLWGVQPFDPSGPGNAGTLEDFIGCSFCSFGNAVGYNVDKPLRYLSVGTGAGNNEFCSFGSTTIYGRPGSNTAHALALRSAYYCQFGPVAAYDCTIAVYAIQYEPDSAWDLANNTIESVVSISASTNATDSVIQIDSLLTKDLGPLHIGMIDATVNGEFGILMLRGTLTVGQATLKTGPLAASNSRLIAVWSSDSTKTTRLSVDYLSIEDNGGVTPVNIGNGAAFLAKHIDVVKGPNTAKTSPIKYENAYGPGSSFIRPIIESIRYTQNGSAENYLYVVFDGVNGFDAWSIGTVEGSGSSGVARFASDTFSIKNSRVLSSSIPTSGAYSPSAILWNSTPSGGGTPGWVCVVGGTPGTWKSMANLSA